MKILHICNDFPYQKLYSNLFNELNALSINQNVFVPLYKNSSIPKNFVETMSTNDVNVIVDKLFSLTDKIFFNKKIRKASDKIFSSLIIKSTDLIHAHTLYTNGAIAYEISKKCNLPYIVAIRNTDINFFAKYMPHLNGYRNLILLNAKKIILISHAYYDKLRSILPKHIWDNVVQKISIIPNGIEPLFFDNNHTTTINSAQKKLLYVGDFSRNKNVPLLIRAVGKLRNKHDLMLTLVGGGGNTNSYVTKLLKKPENKFVNFLGRINDKAKLKEIYQQHHIFVMISKHETFGIVYVEALSQGLPVIHTKNEGVAGYFDNHKFVKATNSQSINEVLGKLEEMITDYPMINKKDVMESISEFNWHKIASNYKIMYESL